MESQRPAAYRGGGGHLKAIREFQKEGKTAGLSDTLQMQEPCTLGSTYLLCLDETCRWNCLNMTRCRISVSILPVKIRLPRRDHLLIMIQGELCSGIVTEVKENDESKSIAQI
ncbi:hypothetical protein MUK42_19623 [Musa troglodytarum]|uniref:Uncharacterized protein n=1 Tax=Musa troglodytarum TaxID=320322 RepID=A0A9E7L2Y3_9LILI|nr:hypothetical protein MUK42_19623 [Musa troglodytarum]